MYTLDEADEATPWFDLREVADSFMFQVLVTGTNTTALETSNDGTYSTKSDAITAESYSSSVQKVAEQPLPKFIRFRMTSWTSGSAKISIGRGRNGAGILADIGVENTSRQPSGAFN